MKIKVKDLQPNPFRDMEELGVDQHLVDSLKASIQESGWWKNILVRKINGKYQIAYGHHRLVALQQLGIEEIDIPDPSDLDDNEMIRIMGKETVFQEKASPRRINSVIETVKNYLDRELAKYESWEEACINNIINTLFENAGNFGRCKKKDPKTGKMEGVGQTTILKFLGEPWAQWQVQTALETIKNKKISRKAREQFDTVTESNLFKEMVAKTKLPKDKQERIAKEVIKIRRERKKDRPPQEEKGSSAYRKQFYKDMKEASPEDFKQEELRVLELEWTIDSFNKKIKALKRASENLSFKFHDMKVEEIHGLAKAITMIDVTEMLEELYRVLKRFGIEKYINNEGGKRNEISKKNK